MGIETIAAERRAVTARRGPIVEIDVSVSWHVLHTKARQEKALASALASAGIEHYLPLTTRTTVSRGRKRTVDTPLFASYLFLRGSRETTFFATSTKRVAGVITVADQTRLAREIAQIRLAIENGADLTATRTLNVGHRVRVTGGPFQGIEGVIERRGRPQRLVLQVAALGRGASLEIDAGLLEPAD